MKLSEFRENYPEYDDIDDDDILDQLDVRLEDGEIHVEPWLPALQGIEEAVGKLHSVIADSKPVDTSAGIVELLKQIKNQLGKLEVAINKIDVQPVVNVAAPNIKIPEMAAPQIPEVVMPKLITEWKFEIIKDTMGRPIEVVAKGN